MKRMDRQGEAPTMRSVEDLKQAVRGSAYVVDNRAVAAALLRRMADDYAQRVATSRRGGATL